MGQALRNNIRLAASDLDGTLLRGFAKSIDPQSFPIIERFCDTGAYFFAASGRQYASLRRLFNPIADRIGYICENGAMAMLHGEALVCREMDLQFALDICRMVDETPGCNYIASGVGTCFAPARKTRFIEHLVTDVKNDVTPVDKPEDIQGPIVKVAFQVEELNKLESTRLQFERAFGNRCRIVTSGTSWLDCLIPGINKATALAGISEKLGISPDDMAAFGDEENDREMLEFVGHPYLMDPCGKTMLDIAELPNAKRCACVEDELVLLMQGI